jgi:hypothetical protein
MRNIKKTRASSTVTYIDRDGNQQCIIIDGNIRTTEQAVKALMKCGLYNVLVDDIKVAKTVYEMPAETFFRYAAPINDNGNDNDNE